MKNLYPKLDSSVSERVNIKFNDTNANSDPEMCICVCVHMRYANKEVNDTYNNCIITYKCKNTFPEQNNPYDI